MPSVDDVYTRLPGVFVDTVEERAALDLCLTEAGLRVNPSIFGQHTSEATILLAAHIRTTTRPGAQSSGATSMSADGVSITYGQATNGTGPTTAFLAEFERLQRIVALSRRFMAP